MSKADDTISREAAIDIALQYCPDDDGVCSKAGHDPREMLDEIEALPSVTPKQRTGHWIPVGVVEVVGGERAMWGSAVAYHKCSKCDGQALKDDFDEEVLSDFCPHCGAKMEGVSNEYS